MIRPAAVAGAFYPADPKKLRPMLAGFLSAAGPAKITGRLRALIVPHAGYIYSGPVAAFGYKLLKKSDFQRVVLLGPAHTVAFSGVALSTAKAWQTPLGQIPLWRPAALPKGFMDFDLAHAQEHCLEVQLPFLQSVVGDLPFCPLVAGEIDAEVAAQGLASMIDDKTLLIISSDLSHYHSYREAQELDGVTVKAIIDGQVTVLEKQGEACGLGPILALLHLARLNKWRGQLLDYRNSGDTAGDKSRVVGYASIAFNVFGII